MLDIPCIIFAGGKSSRMGENKALLPFAGFPTLAEYQYTRLSKIFSNVYISCKTKTLFHFKANFIEDLPYEDLFAPTIGFVSTMKHLHCERYFILSVDAPFVGKREIDRLIKADTKAYDATIAKTPRGIQALCGIYHHSLEQNFEDMLYQDRHKLGLLLHNTKTHFVSFEDEDAFVNLNHPDEYHYALSLLSKYEKFDR